MVSRVHGLLLLLPRPAVAPQPAGCALGTCPARRLGGGSPWWSDEVVVAGDLDVEATPLHAAVSEGHFTSQSVLFRIRAPALAARAGGAAPAAGDADPNTTSTTQTKTTTTRTATTITTQTLTRTTTTTTGTNTTTPEPNATSTTTTATTTLTSTTTTSTTTLTTGTITVTAIHEGILPRTPRASCEPRRDTLYNLLYHAPRDEVEPVRVLGSSRNVAFVLDVSDSMQGLQKLERARSVISHVVGASRDGDRLHLLTFSSSRPRAIDVVFEQGRASQRHELLAAVRSLRPRRTKPCQVRGVGAATPSAVAALKEAELLLSRAEASQQMARYIGFFSDGLLGGDLAQHADVLEQVEALQQEQGVVTHAFAAGTDYDRSLMLSVALTGRGDFLALAGHDYLERSLAAIAESPPPFATGAALWLTPLRVHGDLRVHGHRRRRSRHGLASHVHAGSAVVVPVGTLPYAGTQELLVDMELPDLRAGARFLRYELSGTAWGGNHTRVVQSGFVHVDALRRGARRPPPHPGVSFYKQLQGLLVREECAKRQNTSWREHRELQRDLDALAAEAMREEANDPGLAALGISARAWAARLRVDWQSRSPHDGCMPEPHAHA